MAQPVVIPIQLSKEDFARIERKLDALGDKPIDIPVKPQLPSGGGGLKFMEGTIGDIKQKMAALNAEIDKLGDKDAIREKQAEVKKLSHEMDELLGKTEKAAAPQQKSTAGIGSMVKNFGAGLLVGGAAAGVAGHILDSYLDLDTAKKDLEAVTDLHGMALEKLVASAKSTSDTFGTTWVENIDAAKIAISKLSPAIAEDVDAFDSINNSINTFAKAAKVDAAQSATILSDSINALGHGNDSAAKKAELMAKLMNVMASASQVGAIEADAVSESLLKVGSTMASSNVAMEEGIATIEVLGEVMANGSENGTALKGVMLALGKGRFIPENTKTELAAAGVDVEKLGDKSLSLADRLELLKPVVNDTALLTAYFGESNVVAAQQVINNTEKIRTHTKAMTDTDAATKQAGIQMDSAREKWGRFTNFLSNQAVGALDEVTNMLGRAFGGVEDLFSGDILSGLQDLLDPAAARTKEMAANMKEAAKRSREARAEFEGIAQSVGAAAQAVVHFNRATGKFEEPAESVGELRTRLAEAEAALDGFAKTDTKGIAKQQALIASLRRELEAITGTVKAAVNSNSIDAFNEKISKLAEMMRGLDVTSEKYFDAKKQKARLEATLELITSGAAEVFGNDLKAYKAFIDKVNETIANTPIRPIEALKRPELKIPTAEVDESGLNPEDFLWSEQVPEKMREQVEKLREEMVTEYTSVGEDIGEALARGVSSGSEGLREALREILNMLFDYLQRLVIEATIANAVKNFASAGPLGLIKAGIEALAISGLIQGARAAVTGFSKGGVLVGENGPEVIAPAREFSEMAGAIIQHAMTVMNKAVGEILAAQHMYSRLNVATSVTAEPIEFKQRGPDLYAVVRLQERRISRGTLGDS
jgi:TP901 family phage tail tape measure protein